MATEIPTKEPGFLERYLETHQSRIKDLRYTLHLFRSSFLSMLGFAIIVVTLFLALFGPSLAADHPTYTVVGGINQEHWAYDFNALHLPPSSAHPFGTTQYGRDILSMVLYAVQKDVVVSLEVVVVGLVSGVFLGAIAGYYGGVVDDILMRVTDMFFAFPGLVLALAIVASLGQSLQNIMYALMVVWWPIYARIVRGQVLSVRENQYVEAARSVGASDARIIFRHVLPNAIAPVLVQASLDLGNVILTAAGLSFLGLGPASGTAELGLMVFQGQQHFPEYWWWVTFPGLMILFIVLGFNLLGDGLRDVLDPKLRR